MGLFRWLGNRRAEDERFAMRIALHLAAAMTYRRLG